MAFHFESQTSLTRRSELQEKYRKRENPVASVQFHSSPAGEATYDKAAGNENSTLKTLVLNGMKVIVLSLN